MEEQWSIRAAPHGGPIAAAASYLGLDEHELRVRLANGRTLGKVALEQGRSICGLENALLADLKWHLDADIAAGRVATGQEAQILRIAKTRIDQLVERERRPAPAPAAA
ncbi:MAG TPA: hypothetical protein VLK36_04075 [Gaiellaceae bacterium]|nr:hypothetical protein [Gaiellaceae bacterium]